MSSLIFFVNETFIQKGHQGVHIDMGREIELLMGCLDPPLLLEFGGSFPIV